MARFDVHSPPDTKNLLLICQSDYLNDLPTRCCLPLVPVGAKSPVASRLHPIFDVNGENYSLTPNLAFTIRENKLGRRVGNLKHEQDAIISALDLLVSGF